MSRARTNKENRPKRPSTLGLLLGGTGGRKDASKGAEAERQRRRRERDRSSEMAAYVGYDAMYRDGIAQVMPGMFSQTVEFSDISYQSARKEARETAFTVMSSLFNYFPADSHVQLQVVNAPIPADEVGRKVFFEPGERATSGLAEEYNRILNDKMREGVSNLVRHRYLTYAVGADDVDAAVPKLARIRGDVEQTLARIRCSSRALDGAERLELLQGQLRPGSRFEFSWDKLSPTSGARTKDFVMPSTLDFKPEGRSDCFRSDGRYGAVLAVRSFGSVIEETYLASIIDLPLPLNVTLHVQPIAQSEALALVKRQIDWMDKEIIDEQMSAVKKGYDYQILPPELRFSKEEAEELLDFLRNKSERLFVYTGLVYTWADSLEELDRRVQQVTSVAQGCTIGLEPLHFRQRQQRHGTRHCRGVAGAGGARRPAAAREEPVRGARGACCGKGCGNGGSRDGRRHRLGRPSRLRRRLGARAGHDRRLPDRPGPARIARLLPHARRRRRKISVGRSLHRRRVRAGRREPARHRLRAPHVRRHYVRAARAILVARFRRGAPHHPGLHPRECDRARGLRG